MCQTSCLITFVERGAQNPLLSYVTPRILDDSPNCPQKGSCLCSADPAAITFSLFPFIPKGSFHGEVVSVLRRFPNLILLQALLPEAVPFAPTRHLHRTPTAFRPEGLQIEGLFYLN